MLTTNLVSVIDLLVLLNQQDKNRLHSNPRAIFYIRTLVDLLGTVILYAYESQICEAHTQIELNLIRSALKEQYNQYRN